MLTSVINRLLGGLERLTWDTSDRPLKYPPILMIGAPRTGSTLLYQCFIERYELGYVSNLHHRFYLGPALLERITRVSRSWRTRKFESEFGRSSGWTGPSESWNFWYRFFPRNPQFVPLSAVNPSRMRELRGAIRALGDAMKRPVLFKNMTCAVRLEPIMKYLPEARFLVTHRDLEAVARSTLYARHRVHNSYSEWWSIQPPNFDQLQGLPPHAQVVEQFRGIYDEIDRCRCGPNADWFHDVWYDDLCEQPEAVMQDIRRFLEHHGVRLVDRANLPATFPPRSAPPIDDLLAGELTRYIDATSDKSGHRPGILERERVGGSSQQG